MTVFDLGEPAIQILFLRIRLRVREKPIQERRIGFVLPMMLERVKVGGGSMRESKLVVGRNE
jgi:hypothetical protein